MMETTSERLALLRQYMRQHNLDYYWVPSIDEHFNEYVPACWQRRAFVSDFTGSAGDLLVGLTDAWLWTDSRYFLQAENQLDAASITLMRQGIDPDITAFLAQQATNKTLGLDHKLLSMRAYRQWQQRAHQYQFSLSVLEINLVDQIWQTQPPQPGSAIVLQDIIYAGESVADKLSALRAQLQAQQCNSIVLTPLDSIAWLTNLRGQDSPTVPIFIGYMIIHQEAAVLYVDVERIAEPAMTQLKRDQIEVRAPNQLTQDLQVTEGRVWLDADSTSQWIGSLLSHTEIYTERSPVLLMKAVKNVIEQEGMRDAHRRDAVAIIKLFVWLRSHWRGLDEVDVADQLLRFRAEDPLFKGLSFATISSYASNSAIVHYSPEKPSAFSLGDDSLLLLDMGAQYDCGTTDATRVLHFGQPTAGHIRHYTLVLKGHLALRSVVFLHGTCGEHLDILARQPLWRELMNYGHGTGHGVGCYLEVHEGPQKISPMATAVPLLPGMVVSNEPGVYCSGQYGIRIENLVLVNKIADQAESLTGHGPFYGFEDLTLLPYNRDLIDTTLLTDEEITAINHYHQVVFDVLSDLLPSAEKDWLAAATQSL